jgi:hypothetical protein
MVSSQASVPVTKVTLKGQQIYFASTMHAQVFIYYGGKNILSGKKKNLSGC